MFSVLRTFGIKKEHSTVGHDESAGDDSSLVLRRYRPAPIDELVKRSSFTKRELQIIYRGFKQECPCGLLKEQTVKQVLEQFFPQGDTDQYAALVFKAFDRENVGSLTFEEFIQSLSVLTRGSVVEKAEWIFCLYDVNGDGVISADEVEQVAIAVFDLIGDKTSRVTNISSRMAADTIKLTESFFRKFSSDRNECITKEKFVSICSQDPVILHSMDVLSTILCCS